MLCRALVVQGLAFYDDFFGVSYPFGKYDQLFVPEFNQVRRTPPLRLPHKRCLMCCEGAASLCCACISSFSVRSSLCMNPHLLPSVTCVCARV